MPIEIRRSTLPPMRSVHKHQRTLNQDIADAMQALAGDPTAHFVVPETKGKDGKRLSGRLRSLNGMAKKLRMHDMRLGMNDEGLIVYRGEEQPAPQRSGHAHEAKPKAPPPPPLAPPKRDPLDLSIPPIKPAHTPAPPSLPQPMAGPRLDQREQNLVAIAVGRIVEYLSVNDGCFIREIGGAPRELEQHVIAKLKTDPTYAVTERNRGRGTAPYVHRVEQAEESDAPPPPIGKAQKLPVR